MPLLSGMTIFLLRRDRSRFSVEENLFQSTEKLRRETPLCCGLGNSGVEKVQK